MSEQTKAALAEAIAAHVADECGDVIGPWLVIAETTTLAELADNTSTCFMASHGSRFALRGLAETWRDNDKASSQADEGDDL